VGQIRTNNEDAFGNAWFDDESLLVVVCDGMGGHEAGEVASGIAVRVIEEVMAEDLGLDPRARLYDSLMQANEAILEEGQRSGTGGMGTTAIVALMQGSNIHVGMVGDSRLFHIRNGRMIWRTLDHTRVQMLLDEGMLSEDEARGHPESGMLTRALGHSRMADGTPLAPEVFADPVSIEPGDAVVMSSDGLHDLVEDWEIAKAVAGAAPEAAAESLVALAN
jgi:protein phosphatase